MPHSSARATHRFRIGYRTRISGAEWDALYQIPNTSAVCARFPWLTREEYCTIIDPLVRQALATLRRIAG